MTTTNHDYRTTATCTISWHEDQASGRAYYTAAFADGGRAEIPEEEASVPGPITASTNIDDIVEAVASQLCMRVLGSEHDGAYIHATMQQI